MTTDYEVLAREAKALASNPAFVSALDSARTQVIEAAIACDAKDDDGRKRFLDAAKTVSRVKAHILALAASPPGTVVELSDYYTERQKSLLSRLRG